MNAMVWLAAISVVGAAALFVALALFLRAIDSELEAIGQGGNLTGADLILARLIREFEETAAALRVEAEAA